MKKIVLLLTFVPMLSEAIAQQVKPSPAYDNIQHEQEMKRRNNPQRFIHPDSTPKTNVSKGKLQGTQRLLPTQNEININKHTITPLKTTTLPITPSKKK